MRGVFKKLCSPEYTNMQCDFKHSRDTWLHDHENTKMQKGFSKSVNQKKGRYKDKNRQPSNLEHDVTTFTFKKKHLSGKETLTEVAVEVVSFLLEMLNLSQTYETKFECNKHTDSNTFTSKSNGNMKRQVKISSLTGVGISDDGLT